MDNKDKFSLDIRHKLENAEVHLPEGDWEEVKFCLDVKNCLEEVEVDVPKDDWKQIEKRLPKTERTIPFVWLYSAAATLVLIMTTSIGLILFNYSGKEYMPTAAMLESMSNQEIVEFREQQQKKIQRQRKISKSSSNTNNTNIVQQIALVDSSTAATQAKTTLSVADNKAKNEVVKTDSEAKKVKDVTPQAQQHITITQEEAERLMAEKNRTLESSIEESKKKILPTKKGIKSGWITGASVSMMPEINNAKSNSPLMSSGYSRISESTSHDFPITAGISVGKEVYKNLDILTGVNYTLLRSTTRYLNENSLVAYSRQSLHYIGVPLQASYRFYNHKIVTCYASLGGQMDIGLQQQVSTNHLDTDGQVSSNESVHTPINGFQWSLLTNVGVALNLTKNVKIYVEPGMVWNIPDDIQPASYRTANPFAFNLSMGLRFSFK